MTVKRAQAVDKAIVAAAAWLSVIAAAAALAGAGVAASYCLAVVQVFGVVWLVTLGWHQSRQWATATVITAAAWLVMFTIPSWIYAVDRELYGVASPLSETLALVNVGLFALIAGVVLARRGGTEPRNGPRKVVLVPERLANRRLAMWFVLGVLSLAVLFVANGGPVNYLSNLDETERMNSGLTYVIWGILAMKFVALIVIAERWAAGRRPGVLLAIAAAGICLVLFAVGRAFITIALCQLLLVFVLLRRSLPAWQVACAAALAGLVLVFGLGAVKRYHGYQDSTGRENVSFVDYAADVAIPESVRVYATNYADGVRLVGLARDIVPGEAGHEFGRAFLRLAVHPVPSPLRPEVGHDPALDRLYEPQSGFSYAIPMHAMAYVQFGWAGVVAIFAALGVLLHLVDRRLEARGALRLSDFLALVTLAFYVPFMLRASVPGGVVFALLEVVGIWVVAHSSRSEFSLSSLRRPRDPGRTANSVPA